MDGFKTVVTQGLNFTVSLVQTFIQSSAMSVCVWGGGDHGRITPLGEKLCQHNTYTSPSIIPKGNMSFDYWIKVIVPVMYGVVVRL